jgi:hypothetical protein
MYVLTLRTTRRDKGADPGGGASGARPTKIGKNIIFWRKIVISHTNKPQKFSRLPPLGATFLSAIYK